MDLEKRLNTLRERKKTVSVEIKQQERSITAAQRSFAKDQQLVEEEKSIIAKQQEQLTVEEVSAECFLSLFYTDFHHGWPRLPWKQKKGILRFP